jgi:hypothetical protein
MMLAERVLTKALRLHAPLLFQRIGITGFEGSFKGLRVKLAKTLEQKLNTTGKFRFADPIDVFDIDHKLCFSLMSEV